MMEIVVSSRRIIWFKVSWVSVIVIAESAGLVDIRYCCRSLAVKHGQIYNTDTKAENAVGAAVILIKY